MARFLGMLKMLTHTNKVKAWCIPSYGTITPNLLILVGILFVPIVITT